MMMMMMMMMMMKERVAQGIDVLYLLHAPDCLRLRTLVLIACNVRERERPRHEERTWKFGKIDQAK